ncbi:MAG: helix-turn-helix transcriptional regulator [Clostridiales bacterium]|nr:helix-turn-helix transcriptional regulator [Clostridiales bacterium]
MFDKYLNRTPTSYLTDYRIQKSYEMLRNNSCSITEIASSCGFQNDSYYTYVFHKETGFTPREYRDKFR